MGSNRGRFMLNPLPSNNSFCIVQICEQIFRKKVAGFFVLMMICWLHFPHTAHSGLFSWKDENGKTHFTDSASKIPKKYRSEDKGLERLDKKYPHLSMNQAETESSEPGFGPTSTNPFEITFKNRDAGVHNVDVLLNGGVKAEFIVDTGASFVTISKSLAKKLDLNTTKSAPHIQFTTAGGKVWSPLVVLQSIKVGDAEVHNVEANVNQHMGDLDGLLGQTFLSEFEIHMDAGSNRMMLRPRSRPDEPLWGNKNANWWKGKFKYFKQARRQAKAMAQHPEQVKVPSWYQFKSLEEYYENLYQSLYNHAVSVGLPAYLLVSP